MERHWWVLSQTGHLAKNRSNSTGHVGCVHHFGTLARNHMELEVGKSCGLEGRLFRSQVVGISCLFTPKNSTFRAYFVVLTCVTHKFVNHS